MEASNVELVAKALADIGKPDLLPGILESIVDVFVDRVRLKLFLADIVAAAEAEEKQASAALPAKRPPTEGELFVAGRLTEQQLSNPAYIEQVPESPDLAMLTLTKETMAGLQELLACNMPLAEPESVLTGWKWRWPDGAITAIGIIAGKTGAWIDAFTLPAPQNAVHVPAVTLSPHNTFSDSYVFINAQQRWCVRVVVAGGN